MQRQTVADVPAVELPEHDWCCWCVGVLLSVAYSAHSVSNVHISCKLPPVEQQWLTSSVFKYVGPGRGTDHVLDDNSCSSTSLALLKLAVLGVADADPAIHPVALLG